MVAEPYRTEKLGKMVVSPWSQTVSAFSSLARRLSVVLSLFCSLVLHGLLLPLYVNYFLVRIQACVLCLLLGCVRLFAVPWTAACQAPLSMEFFRQEYWSQLLFLTPGDLPDPGIKPVSLIFFTAGRFFYHQRHLEIPMFLPPTKSAPKSEFH